MYEMDSPTGSECLSLRISVSLQDELKKLDKNNEMLKYSITTKRRNDDDGFYLSKDFTERYDGNSVNVSIEMHYFALKAEVERLKKEAGREGQ